MEFQRILIIKPSSLGDIIHTFPVLNALRARYPKAHLAWFIHEKWADLVEGHPDLDETIPWSFRWGALGSLIGIFRKKRFDLAVDLQGLFRSGVISYLSGAPVRVGFKNGREGSVLFYTHKVDVPQHPIHAIDRYLLVAKSLGAVPRDPVCTLAISQQDEEVVDALLKRQGLAPSREFIALNPMARWWTKRWPIQRFAQLADLIQGTGTAVVLMGGRDDVAEIKRMQSLMRTSAFSVAGETTLKQLAGLLRKARLLISNDSGPVHLAVAVGTPVVALFGPTDPLRTGPYRHLSVGARAATQDAGPPMPPRPGQSPAKPDAWPPIVHTVIRRTVECSPCLSRWCRVGDHRCMMEIEVGEVFEAVKKIVNR